MAAGYIFALVVVGCSGATADGTDAWRRTQLRLQKTNTLQFAFVLDVESVGSPADSRQYRGYFGFDRDTNTSVVEGQYLDSRHRLVLPKGSVWNERDGYTDSQVAKTIAPISQALVDGFRSCKAFRTDPKSVAFDERVTVSCPEVAAGHEFEVVHVMRRDGERAVKGAYWSMGNRKYTLGLSASLYDEKLPSGFGGDEVKHVGLPFRNPTTLEEIGFE